MRASIARIRAEVSIPHEESVRGFVYEIDDGSFREKTPEGDFTAAQR